MSDQFNYANLDFLPKVKIELTEKDIKEASKLMAKIIDRIIEEDKDLLQ